MKKVTAETLPYRPGVGILLLNREGKVFVGSRIDTRTDAWQMPQGGIDPGETPEEAALRECLEEVGTNKVEITAESSGWYVYDLPDELLGKIWGGKYRGQKQRWFVFRFLGEDTDIQIDGEHPEFHDWRWVDLEEIPDLAIYFKRRMYEGLLEEFRPVVAAFLKRS
ncbi:MAG: RNA pyrophosphohydrolase [Alphaproteobacteria bacterium]|nr:RNA pyrophosphohydrolase [Alphaproteobacteria bacterium]